MNGPSKPSASAGGARTLIEGLCDAAAYAHPVGDIRLIETHISWVLLTGDYAYKIKKPVDFGFLDFSSLDKRRYYCEEELRLNRRFSETLYLDVTPVTGSPDRPQMGGRGEAIEYAVRMRQFDNEQLLDRLAAQGQLHIDLVDAMTGAIAGFHQRAERATPDSPWGEADDIQHWFQENIDHIRPLLEDRHRLQQLDRLQAWGRSEWQRRIAILRERKQWGRVRECHGDLHLGNMVRIDGRVTLFDCIEFNPKLRWIDVISEVAFLYMDLLHRGLEYQAHHFLNRYLQQTGDYPGLALLRYYLVYRALVRAKVAILRLAQETDENERRQTLSDYEAYADLAERATQAGRPMLMIAHGFSGSGKSTLGVQLAANLGLLQIRSDIERKRLFGYAPGARTESGVAAGIYGADAGRRTYQRLAELAEAVIGAGYPVLVDATFLKRDQRARFRALASAHGIPFRILDFQAPEAELRRRIDQRAQRATDPSEATLAVMERQLQEAQPLTGEEQALTLSIDTTAVGARERLMAQISITD